MKPHFSSAATLAATAAVCALALPALAGPVTVTGGYVQTKASDDSFFEDVVTVFATQNLNAQSIAQQSGSIAINMFQFAHDPTSSNFAFDMDHHNGPFPGQSTTLFTVIDFTVSTTSTYTFDGAYFGAGDGLLELEGSLRTSGGTEIYRESEYASGPGAATVLDDSGLHMIGSRTGSIGPGSYSMRLVASSENLSFSTPSAFGFFNVSFEENPPVVPLPSGAAMAMVGLGIVGVRRRRA